MVKKKMMKDGGNVPKQKSTRSRKVTKYTDGYKTVEKYKKRNGKIKDSDELKGPGRDKSKTVRKYNESTGKGSKKNINVKDGKRTVDKYNYKTGGTVNPNVGTKNMATPLLAKKGMDMGYNPMAKMGMAKKPSMLMSNKELMEYKKGAAKKYKTGGMVNPNMGAKAKTPK